MVGEQLWVRGVDEIVDRPYQSEAVEAIFDEWSKGNRRTLLVLPTGTGKTIVFCRVIERIVREGGRVLVLAHRGELLEQAADKLARATGLGCGVEKGESSGLDEWWPAIIGSVQTMMRSKRLVQFTPDFFEAIIVDEAHHALADSYQRVLDHFSGANVLGVTATPDRGDMRNLGAYFDSLAYEYLLPRAIRDGYLSPIKALTIPLQIDITSVSQSSGDYKASELGSALDPYLEQIADEMAAHCYDRKTLLFLPLIATSKKMQAILASRGFYALEVNGESQDRAETLARFAAAGPRTTCCNSMLLTEGYDCPSIDCIVPLRATKIRSLFAQMVGRGTRLSPGKDHLLLLDFLWNTQRLDLCRPAHLIAENAEVAAKMTDTINEAGCPVDIIKAETQAESDCIAEREAALAKELAAQRHRKRKLVDPLQFEMSIAAQDLSDYVPAFGWEMAPPTADQIAALEQAGIYPGEIECAGKASKLLDRLSKRRHDKLTTPKQIRFLESKGFEHVGQWDFDAARKLINRIAANNWTVPRDINPTSYKPKREAVASTELPGQWT